MTPVPDDTFTDPFEVPGLVDRYLAGEASPGESDVMRRWVEVDADRGRLITVLAAGRKIASMETTRPVIEGDLSSVFGVVRRRVTRYPRQAHRIVTGRSPWWVLAGGGALAIALIASVIKMPSSPDSVLKTSHYTTQQAQRAKVELPDGSAVILAPESRLMVSADFGITSRTVELDGEALFIVPRSSGRPFVVKTSVLETRVLGTMFVVKRYQADPSARVLVAEGKVEVSTSRDGREHADTRMLTIGEEVIIEEDGTLSPRSNVDVVASLGWTQGRLPFNSVPLGKVLDDIRRFFGFDIRLSMPLADQGIGQQRVSGMITEQMKVEDAARLLAGILGVDVRRNGSVYILTE